CQRGRRILEKGNRDVGLQELDPLFAEELSHLKPKGSTPPPDFLTQGEAPGSPRNRQRDSTGDSKMGPQATNTTTRRTKNEITNASHYWYGWVFEQPGDGQGQFGNLASCA